MKISVKKMPKLTRNTMNRLLKSVNGHYDAHQIYRIPALACIRNGKMLKLVVYPYVYSEYNREQSIKVWIDSDLHAVLIREGTAPITDANIEDAYERLKEKMAKKDGAKKNEEENTEKKR